MRVKVERYMRDGFRRVLMFGVNEQGQKVSFHVVGIQSQEMANNLDAGNPVYAELPDTPDLIDLHGKPLRLS